MDGSSKSIGDLPDMILQHILSLLPTEVAVGTSVLSKRWQYLWTSIPNLVFTEGLPAKRMLFLSFVERVLLLHDFSNVEKFSLTCDVLYDASRINAWISAAIRHNVQKIDICLDKFEEPFVLPHCLFTCDSLKMLRVEMCHILKVPSSICFSSLRCLVLKGVIFSDEYSTEQLFSGCPILETLWIARCIWENLKAVSIFVPNLQKLAIEEFNYDDEDLSDVNGCEVNIFGMSLKSFHYSGDLLNEYCLCNSPSLVTAHIDVIPSCENTRIGAYRVKQLLIGLSSVNDLSISRGAIELLNEVEEFFTVLPVYRNLTYLQLTTVPMCFDFKALLNILQKSPCLETLIFHQGIKVSPSCVEDDDGILDPVPSCFLSHLKRIEVYNFKGNEEQLYVIKILLKKATMKENEDDYNTFSETDLDNWWEVKKTLFLRKIKDKFA
ncbi:hypothetical protein L1049_012254 [Liquidambar formosana]|uniref:F-box domain-containing protein n=1 Tax=Liquidambar formosana TaxID=63359 RepID=A0AAP0RSP6_LIQFO